METIKQMKRRLMKQYGMLDNEALEKLIAKERKLRCEMNEAIKNAKRNLKKAQNEDQLWRAD